jgi:dihydroorotate dehydrogenase (NAD+) catalytic subunit
MAAAVDMRVTIGSISLPNPLMTASGTAGHGAEFARHMPLGSLGAVVVKSLAAYAWLGNPGPRVAPTDAGMLNAVGLQGPGVQSWLESDLPRLLRETERVVVSIWGRTVAEYEKAAAMLADAPAGVIAVEVNLSCPNLEGRSGMFAHSASATADVIAATAACGRPRWAKLSPNTHQLVEIAAAAEAAGAEAVTLINTVLGMVIDPETCLPVLGNGGGGLSGSAIRPVAVRAIYDVRAALPDLPIVGVGGISRAEHAVELMAAGAAGVQIGTASFLQPRAARRVLRSLESWCAERAIASVGSLTSAAHHSQDPSEQSKESS